MSVVSNVLSVKNKIVFVPGVIFGDFADTEEKKKKLYPMLVVNWDKDAKHHW